MSPPVFRIIIVGGGIAGFAAAIALRGPNRHITVLEQSSLNKEIGALISFQPNASRIIQSNWGLDSQNARPMVDEGFRIYNTDGELINAIPLLAKKVYEADRLLFHRRDLHDNLKHHATSAFPSRDGNPVEVRIASKVVKCDVLSGVVTLESGEELSADLIVGADGMQCDAQICLARRTTRTSYANRIVSISFDGPGRQAEVYGITVLVPDEQMNEDPNAKQSWVAEGDLKKIRQSFSEFPAWVTSIFKYEITNTPLKD
ncbi:hypothetical protein N7478_003910 [Penicillium angulare]|uniref:uncharacterized protein n=1 Tax=Penicillium angulare TaxID=116970 RepID=UPI0025414EF2|nr:uncharacterized protein N7478_003910 [Penicillium angulare]KAJ5288224.1 hypothetical protein N7478_003910 [Penicillium angulare]